MSDHPRDADPRARSGAPAEVDSQALGVDRAMLDQAVGGWRGMIDSGLPAAVFVIAYVVTAQQLRLSLVAAVFSGAVIAVLRLVRREPQQQVAAGFMGVAISAFIATRTGRAEDFFLVGIVINVVYLIGYGVGTAFRWPPLGLIVGYFRGDATGWRSDPRQYRAYATASWIWAGMFAVRLLVQVPIYVLGAVELLGVAKLVMGWPLFLLCAYLSYQIIHPVLREVDSRAADAARSSELGAESA